MDSGNNSVEEILTTINGEIGDYLYQIGMDMDVNFDLNYSTNGYVQVINFLGYPIWNSEDEPREWCEDDVDYEPLENFLRGEVMKLVKVVSGINVEGDK